MLNPLGINCFRFFEDRGYRLWGARTVSSDPEWKYVNVRRYFIYLEHSIDKGRSGPSSSQMARLCGPMSAAPSPIFLLNEWPNGALLGN